MGLNAFKDNNEKSCSWSRNKVSHKIDFKAQWLCNGHVDSVGVNFGKILAERFHISDLFEGSLG